MKNIVSIIMPIYNRENKINKAIDSILCQTYKFWELILVNDGSTDNTEEFCNKYLKKDKRIKYLKIKNSGPGEARNKGILTAKGKYIMFIDSDDFYEEKMVETMVESIEKYECECVICNRIINNKNKKITRDFADKDMIIENKQEFIEYFQKNNLFNSVWNKIYLKKIIDEFNIRFDKNFISGEDYKFNLDYFNHINKAKAINKYLYNYVMNPNSIVHSIKSYDFFMQVKIVDYNVKIYNDNNYDEKKIYYKYLIIAIDGISYKIQSEKKYNSVKKYIENIINYPSIQKILTFKFESTLEHKIFGLLLRKNMKKTIYIYIYCRNIFKTFINKIKKNI